MKVPLSWLREYVDVTITPKELAHRLTMAGTEVAGITIVGGGWERIVVGQVVAVEPHPKADRLKLATVDLGQERQTVVCGAPNIAPGQKVPFAREGSRLIDSRTGEMTTLQATTIRGVLSAGMVCSQRELGLGEDHTGIVVLPHDAPVGGSLNDYLGDAILDLDVTPNRPDCLSMLGIAWEVAALTGTTVRPLDLTYPEEGPPIQEQATVKVEDPQLAPRYTASLITGVKIQPSPKWMQERLQRVGQRPINNVVDITNYVMLETGQPLHAFDYHTLAERTIIVRQAWKGEVVVTLDGEERKLHPPSLVIADAQRAVAIAGIIGGGNTEVTEQTTAVLVESANFSSTNNRRTAGAFKLRTEASIRFEKGLNPGLAELGLRRATQLIAQLAGGQVAQGIIDVYPGKWEPQPIPLTHKRIHQVLGVDFPQEQVQQVLTSLGFRYTDTAPIPGEGRANTPSASEPSEAKGEALMVAPPVWRSDIAIEDDLVEEVARIVGYEAIPVAMPTGGGIPHRQSQPLRELRERVRDLLVSVGLQETISYSLVSKALMEMVDMEDGGPAPLRTVNPMSAQQEYLRTTLRGSILATLAANERQTSEGLRLFEMGRVYLPREHDLPHEKEMAVGVLSGPYAPTPWLGEKGLMGFFEAKGVVESLLHQLGLHADFLPHHDSLMHPGRCGQVKVGDILVGVVGEVHPKVLERFDIATPVVSLFEVDLEALYGVVPADSRSYTPIPRYPGAVRDMALVVDQEVPSQRILALIKAHPLVIRAVLFDIYAGQGISSGKRSLAYRVTLQSSQGTLTTQQVNQAQQEILKTLRRETGATLRG